MASDPRIRGRISDSSRAWARSVGRAADELATQIMRKAAKNLMAARGANGRPLAPNTGFTTAVKRAERLSTKVGQRRGSMLRALKILKPNVRLRISQARVSLEFAPRGRNGLVGGRLGVPARLARFERGARWQVKEEQSKKLKYLARKAGLPVGPNAFAPGTMIDQKPRQIVEWDNKLVKQFTDRVWREALQFWR